MLCKHVEQTTEAGRIRHTDQRVDQVGLHLDLKYAMLRDILGASLTEMERIEALKVLQQDIVAYELDV